jgi:DNA-binding IclR family transcriptional regulator
VGQLYDGHRELAELAATHMEALTQRLGETVQLARLDGIENVYIAISESPQPIRLASSVGMRLHAHATALGKALLAQLPREEAERRLTSVVLPRFTDSTVTDAAELLDEMAAVRRDGYALDRGEYLPGTQCVAVPLLDDGDGLIAALSVTAPSSRCTADWPADVLPELDATAALIRSRLGLAPVGQAG